MSLLCSDVYQLLLDELRADKRGLSCEIGEFNRALRMANNEIYDQYISNFESDQDSIDSLAWFKVHNFTINLTSGVGTLPLNYYRLIGKPRALFTDGVTYKKVDLVTTYELACREDDFLTQPTTTYPLATIGGVNATSDTQIRVVPTTITSVQVDYLKMLDVPYLDYYVNNQTYLTSYLPESSTPQSIPAGHTYSGGTVGGSGVTVLSLTKNMVWDDGDIYLILAKLKKHIGVALPDNILLESGMIDEQKAS